jgi:hypothetical protein
VEKIAKEKFPWLLADKDPAGTGPENGEDSKAKPGPQFDELFKDDSDDEEEKPWIPGKWVDYRFGLGNINRQLHKIYEAEGRRFPKFETEWILRDGEPIADVRVKVLNEGLAMELGTIHLVGNSTNTREETLDYLGLSPGMPIKQGFVDDLRRKLYHSGRFLGWEVLATQANPSDSAPGRLELLLVVAEHWQAPPLSTALSREQTALRKFAQWLNRHSAP